MSGERIVIDVNTRRLLGPTGQHENRTERSTMLCGGTRLAAIALTGFPDGALCIKSNPHREVTEHSAADGEGVEEIPPMRGIVVNHQHSRRRSLGCTLQLWIACIDHGLYSSGYLGTHHGSLVALIE